MMIGDGVKHRVQGPAIAHFHVRDLAEEMVNEAYEIMALRHDWFYREWPDRKVFCATWRESFLHAARQSLIDTLKNPDASERTKQEAYDVLLLDGSIPGYKDRGLENMMRR